MVIWPRLFPISPAPSPLLYASSAMPSPITQPAFEPQQVTPPLLRIAQVNAAPKPKDVTVSPVGNCTTTRALPMLAVVSPTSVVLPIPSCPLVLEPQHTAREPLYPTVHTAQECSAIDEV